MQLTENQGRPFLVTSGVYIDFDDWAPYEPNGWFSGEDTVMLLKDGDYQWADVNRFWLIPGVCEKQGKVTEKWRQNVITSFEYVRHYLRRATYLVFIPCFCFQSSTLVRAPTLTPTPALTAGSTSGTSPTTSEDGKKHHCKRMAPNKIMANQNAAYADVWVRQHFVGAQDG